MLGQCAGLTYDTLAALHTRDNATEIGARPLRRLLTTTRNHRICESMFLAGYIEKYGTGTLMMIRESVEHALPEPMFKQSGGEFVAVVGRDWLTEEFLTSLNLSDRQFRAVITHRCKVSHI